MSALDQAGVADVLMALDVYADQLEDQATFHRAEAALDASDYPEAAAIHVEDANRHQADSQRVRQLWERILAAKAVTLRERK